MQDTESLPKVRLFEGGTFVQGFEKVGYNLICIGELSFFDKRTALGKVMLAYFKYSFWRPSFRCLNKDSIKNKIDFALKQFDKFKGDKLFMYINISAIHYPTYFYINKQKEDDIKSHAKALRYANSQLKQLFQAFKDVGKTSFVIATSEHGTCFGEDGFFSLRPLS